MMAIRTSAEQSPPRPIEALLPWYATGSLDARDARRVEAALAQDAGLARQLEAILQEQAETVRVNEGLGAPSPRAIQRLFAAIDAEPEQPKAATRDRFGAISAFLATLQPRTLAWSGAVAAAVIVVQAAAITAVLMKDGGEQRMQTASYDAAPPAGNIVTRSMQGRTAPAGSERQVVIRFAADARAADIAALLDAYQAAIVGSGRGGLYRLQLGNRAGRPADAAAVIAQLQGERIVSFVGPAQ